MTSVRPRKHPLRLPPLTSCNRITGIDTGAGDHRCLCDRDIVEDFSFQLDNDSQHKCKSSEMSDDSLLSLVTRPSSEDNETLEDTSTAGIESQPTDTAPIVTNMDFLRRDEAKGSATNGDPTTPKNPMADNSVHAETKEPRRPSTINLCESRLGDTETHSPGPAGPSK